MYKSGCSLSFRFDFMAGLPKKGRYADEIMQILEVGGAAVEHREMATKHAMMRQ